MDVLDVLKERGQDRMALSAVPAFSNTKAYLCLGDRPLTGPGLGLSAHPVPLHPGGDYSRAHRAQLLFLEKAAADTWSGGLPHLKYRGGRPSLAALSLIS